MNKYQKLHYQIAKAIYKHENGINNYKLDSVYNIYKAHKKYNKDKSIEELLGEYRHEQRWNKWFSIYRWQWNEELGHAQWLNRDTNLEATNQDIDNVFNN
jgi:hypothetical protein